MKRFLLPLALGLALAGSAAAQTPNTALTGTILSQGTPVTGFLFLQLSGSANVLGGGCGGPALVAASPPFIFPLTAGQVPGGSVVWGANCLSPTGLTYRMTATSSNGQTVVDRNVSITGSSVDIGNLAAVGGGTSGGGGSGSNGTVTTVGNGTISSLFVASWANATTTPALSLDLAQQNSNCVIASPPGGGSGIPTCRSLVIADIPASVHPLTTKGDLYCYSTVNDRIAAGTNGQLLSANSGQPCGVQWITASGTGTLTQLNQGSGITLTPNPTTTTGTVNLGPLTADWPAGPYNANAANSTDWINVKTKYGAKGDTVVKANGTMGATSTTLTTSTSTFAAGDVGKYILVAGAGASGWPLGTTISAFTSATQPPTPFI